MCLLVTQCRMEFIMPIPKVPTEVTIPKAEALDTVLKARDDHESHLLTSNMWVRGMYVYAHCDPRPGSRTSPENRGGRLTFTEFAARQFKGMKDPDTVARLHKTIKDAIADRTITVVPEPGKTVPIPQVPWPKVVKTKPTSGPADVARRWVHKEGDLILNSWTEFPPEVKADLKKLAMRIVEMAA